MAPESIIVVLQKKPLFISHVSTMTIQILLSCLLPNFDLVWDPSQTNEKNGNTFLHCLFDYKNQNQYHANIYWNELITFIKFGKQYSEYPPRFFNWLTKSHGNFFDIIMTSKNAHGFTPIDLVAASDKKFYSQIFNCCHKDLVILERLNNQIYLISYAHFLHAIMSAGAIIGESNYDSLKKACNDEKVDETVVLQNNTIMKVAVGQMLFFYCSSKERRRLLAKYGTNINIPIAPHGRTILCKLCTNHDDDYSKIHFLVHHGAWIDKLFKPSKKGICPFDYVPVKLQRAILKYGNLQPEKLSYPTRKKGARGKTPASLQNFCVHALFQAYKTQPNSESDIVDAFEMVPDAMCTYLARYTSKDDGICFLKKIFNHIDDQKTIDEVTPKYIAQAAAYKIELLPKSRRSNIIELRALGIMEKFAKLGYSAISLH